MGQLVISVVGGGTLGATFALMGLGLVLAFRATGTLSFVHGQLMLLCAYVVAYTQRHHTLEFWLALVLALVISAVISMLFYLFVLQRMAGLPHFVGFVATLGLAAVLDGVMPLIFGSDDYGIAVPGVATRSVGIFGTDVSLGSIELALGSLVLALIVTACLRYTRYGVAVRAAGQDPILASQSGIQVRRLHLVSWAAAGILAGLAGVVYGSTSVVNTSLVDVALAAFPAILLGGLDSIDGAILGGLAIGLVQGFTASYLGGQYVDVVTYAVLLVVMLVRPQGFFGTRSVLRT